MVVGVDHGFGLIKTAHTEFVAGIVSYDDKPPRTNNCVFYNGKYYVVGGTRQAVMVDKTENDNYYIMTLAAIAKEMALIKTTKAKIVLCAGLPLQYFTVQQKKFMDYLKRNKTVKFQFEEKDYSIEIERVFLFPQGLASVSTLKDIDFSGTVYLIDVGSNTIEIVPLVNGEPNMNELNTLALAGVIKAYKMVNKDISPIYNIELPESEIVDVILDRKSNLPNEAKEVVENALRGYTSSVIDSLLENRISIKLSKCVFIGGGASVIRKYSDVSGQSNIVIVEDIHANAIGYETMGKLLMKGKK